MHCFHNVQFGEKKRERERGRERGREREREGERERETERETKREGAGQDSNPDWPTGVSNMYYAIKSRIHMVIWKVKFY